jgi:hypothetical protein
MRRQITVSEIVNEGIESARNTLYHCMPGSVVAFYASEQTVDVQPMVNDTRNDIDTGATFSEQWPVLPHVPISYPRGGGYAMAFPMKAGDSVMLISHDLDPTAWRTTGNRSDPADTRRHVGSYWWAIPCDLTVPNAMKSASTAGDALVLGLDGGTPLIIINASSIQLGSSGGDFVALASKVNAAITAQGTWAAGGTGSGYTPPVVASQPVPDVGSSLIKAQ